MLLLLLEIPFGEGFYFYSNNSIKDNLTIKTRLLQSYCDREINTPICATYLEVINAENHEFAYRNGTVFCIYLKKNRTTNKHRFMTTVNTYHLFLVNLLCIWKRVHTFGVRNVDTIYQYMDITFLFDMSLKRY